MKKRKIFLNEKNPNNKHTISNILKGSFYKESKAKIHKEIFDIINQNMDNIKMNLNNSNENSNFSNILNTLDKEKFINYNGENLSILSNSNSENYISNNDDSIPNEKDKEKGKKVLIFENSSMNASLKSKDNNTNKIISLKNYNNNNNPRDLPIYDSSSTSNSCKKKINNISINKINSNIIHSPKIVNDTNELKNELNYLKANESELINFFLEIKLPLIYAFKFIENGFDDLKILIDLTKTTIAISNKNLKDIGISNAGDRAKILIHLEEKAGVFPIILEKKIIYDNSSNCNSLGKFLLDYKCEIFTNNFKKNGYYNSELLYCQMLIREPINKNNIIKDLGIKDEYYINNILRGLEDESKKYLKKLKKIYNFFDLNYTNKYCCDSCLIV